MLFHIFQKRRIFLKTNFSAKAFDFKCRSQLRSLEKLAWGVLRRNNNCIRTIIVIRTWIIWSFKTPGSLGTIYRWQNTFGFKCRNQQQNWRKSHYFKMMKLHCNNIFFHIFQKPRFLGKHLSSQNVRCEVS